MNETKKPIWVNAKGFVFKIDEIGFYEIERGVPESNVSVYWRRHDIKDRFVYPFYRAGDAEFFVESLVMLTVSPDVHPIKHVFDLEEFAQKIRNDNTNGREVAL